jgi:hypothetical protein
MPGPFRVHTPADHNPNQTHRPTNVDLPGKQVYRSQRSGDPLPNSSTDAPDHEPIPPWPADKPLENGGPMKGLK